MTTFTRQCTLFVFVFVFFFVFFVVLFFVFFFVFFVFFFVLFFLLNIFLSFSLSSDRIWQISLPIPWQNSEACVIHCMYSTMFENCFTVKIYPLKLFTIRESLDWSENWILSFSWEPPNVSQMPRVNTKVSLNLFVNLEGTYSVEYT